MGVGESKKPKFGADYLVDGHIHQTKIDSRSIFGGLFSDVLNFAYFGLQ